MASTANTAEISCPVCGKPAPSFEGNRAFPFCSHRCQLVDLGRWLDEDYRIGDDDGFEGAPILPAGDVSDGEPA